MELAWRLGAGGILTTRVRAGGGGRYLISGTGIPAGDIPVSRVAAAGTSLLVTLPAATDRKSTRLNSSHH